MEITCKESLSQNPTCTCEMTGSTLGFFCRILNNFNSARISEACVPFMLSLVWEHNRFHHMQSSWISGLEWWKMAYTKQIVVKGFLFLCLLSRLVCDVSESFAKDTA